ncbi:uncharacterized protein ISCGN_016583 [Ixodes scapularis]
MNRSADGTSSNGDGAFSTVHLRLPTYKKKKKNPRAWFSRVEAQFHLRRITSRTARYYHVVSALPQEVTAKLDDVLTSSRPDYACDYIKRAILARKTESEASRLQQLLNTEERGAPSTLSAILHRMRQLLDKASVAHAQ